MNEIQHFPYDAPLVLGLAKSGTAACELLIENGFDVKANDLKAKVDDPSIVKLQRLGVEVVTGGHPLSLLDNVDVIIKNPGINYENTLIQEAIKRDIPILTEIELIHYLTNNPVIGITGSNGKTTTTTLVHQMLIESNKATQVAGNIGKVASETASKLKTDETLVVELSSFQLMGIQQFQPKISVFLNLFQAHLDYHHTFENYKNAKANIFKNQQENDYLVYNADDPVVSDLVAYSNAAKIPFSTQVNLPNGAWCDDKNIYFKKDPIVAREDIALVGNHNLENILAASSAALLAGATFDGVRHVLTTFTGVKHRLQYVRTFQERLFYNDSKATNILATSKALSAFDRPVILLAGGLDRGNDFDDLIPYLQDVKAMVVFGETANKLHLTGKTAGVASILHVETMKQAVEEAYRMSNENDVILLSPACASWDQYRTFEERGDMFTEAVHTLK
ncbi:UDP-N-acetylmuramoylalanine--D-glutamate ligase [Paraliobacillus ryukyuensis]|uniref:UDP-N-acetylmuramoylalanine--D-glutamate ligase n=1 Tax=Paraliobacillus ryukyuensis TaxID=200904 RepID=A0A366EHG4_9BACI|nr:UDP-N-acetylmuramoyl-L-alanine--D-glutamate ligase [Paraliobacillus ryukyuensis]RBP01891.1 UDP-N-acetylmuramoylalanine--D-glutamate ligase [Paraliobacillus ryukyuensis]